MAPKIHTQLPTARGTHTAGGRERDAAPFLRSTVATNRRCARVNCDVRIGLILAPHLAGRSYHFCVLAQRGCCGAPDGFSQRSFRPGVLRSVPPPDVYLTQLAFVRRPPHHCGVATGENLSLFNFLYITTPDRVCSLPYALSRPVSLARGHAWRTCWAGARRSVRVRHGWRPIPH